MNFVVKNMTGMVSEIQRFSVGDGDGIRTTVFMQGCNLRCPWCHNPETIPMEGARLVYKHLPDEVKISGKHMTVGEVFDIVVQDMEFYKKSNGGITLSGGEPLLQVDFCVELARKCRDNAISVIIDTAGDVPFESIEKVIPFTDCFYYDLKCDIDDYKKIGANGQRVFDNLLRLASISKVVARLPIVPGFNDGMMETLAEFLSTTAITEVHLLPFHRLGSGKYKALGLTYAYESHAPCPADRFVEHFTRKNLICTIEN